MNLDLKGRIYTDSGPLRSIRSDLFPQKTCTGRCQVLISLKRPIRQVAWAIGNTLNDVSQLARPLFSKSQRTFQNEITSSSIASRSFPQNFQIVLLQFFFLTRIFPYHFRNYCFVVNNLLKTNTSFDFYLRYSLFSISEDIFKINLPFFIP